MRLLAPVTTTVVVIEKRLKVHFPFMHICAINPDVQTESRKAKIPNLLNATTTVIVVALHMGTIFFFYINAKTNNASIYFPSAQIALCFSCISLNSLLSLGDSDSTKIKMAEPDKKTHSTQPFFFTHIHAAICSNQTK